MNKPCLLKMKIRIPPRTKDLALSEIGFGCMSLGTDQSLNERMIHKAKDHGITFFDTADLYQHGENELALGKAISGRREGLVIATKVGNRWNDDLGSWEWTPKKNYILKAADESLRRLGIEHIDLYQLHGGTIDDNFEEVIEAFEILKGQGKIRYYGLSSIRPNVFNKLAQESNIVTNMMQYSLLDRRPETYLKTLHEKGVGVLARGSLAKGILAGKPISNYLNHNIQSIELMVDKLKSFSIEKNDMVHLAIDWLLAVKSITSVVVGVSKMDQIDALIDFPNRRVITQEQREELSNALTPMNYEDHLV